jgi:chromosome segregation ATPase
MSFFKTFRSRSGSNDGLDSEGKDVDAVDTTTPPPPTNPPPPPPPVINENITVTVEDEPDEDPVRAQLEKDVRQRDSNISALEKVRNEKKQDIVNLEMELEKERLQQMKEALTHKIESERIKRQTTHTEERLKALEADMQDKAAIHEYANLIKGVAPKSGVDSQYVMKLQAQLQKAVKKMETTNEQMKELEENSRQVVNGLSLEISELVEERCRTELELRKQMEVLNDQKRDMQLQYEERIKENLKTLQALRAKAASQTTIEELEEELEETELRLEELNRIQETQERTIAQLNKSLAVDGAGEIVM